MEENIYSVYIHINKINQKVYVGQTMQNPPEKRWANGYGYASSSHFWNAIQKYGWDNFEHKILKTGLSKKEANKMEIDLIKQYDSTNQYKGYNITLGGEGAKGLSGNKNPMYGISPQERMNEQTFEEWKNKIGIKSKEWWANLSQDEYKELCKKRQGVNHPRCKKIYCPGLDEEFDYINQAAIKYGLNKSNISHACKDWHYTAGKHPYTGELLHWCYIEDKDVFSIPEPRTKSFEITPEWIEKQRISHIGLLKGFNNPRCKYIYCIELKQLFWGAMDAYNQYGIDNSSLGKCCKGKIKSVGKHPETNEPLHWIYAQDAIDQGYITQENVDKFIQEQYDKQGDKNQIMQKLSENT